MEVKGEHQVRDEEALAAPVQQPEPHGEQRYQGEDHPLQSFDEERSCPLRIFERRA